MYIIYINHIDVYYIYMIKVLIEIEPRNIIYRDFNMSIQY